MLASEHALSRFRRMFFTQAQFDDWADAAKGWHRVALGGALLLVAVACIAAIAVMGPRLAREGSLLWFGTQTEGTVAGMKVEEHGRFKGGDPKYRITIDYRFTTASGSRHEGTTIRTDVRTPPDLEPGDPIGVYYAPSNPTNSVAEHNLRIDVYALVLFLPFLAFMGIACPLHWAWRYRRWRRRRALAPK